MRMKKLQILLPIALLFFVMLAAGSSAAQEKNTSKKNNSDTYMISAEQAYLKNNFKEAMANCVSALEQNPENDAAYHLMAKISLSLNKMDDAEKFVKKISGKIRGLPESCKHLLQDWRF